MNKNKLLVLLASLVLTGCGYTITEKDKYPEMAIFPNVDGNGILLKKETINYNKIYKIDGNLVTIDNDIEKGFAYLLILDKAFNIIDSVKLKSHYNYISSDGFIYYKNKNDTYSKMHYLRRKIIKIPKHPVNLIAIHNRVLDSIKTAQLAYKDIQNDSLLLNEREQLGLAYNLSIYDFIKKIQPNLIETKIIDHEYHTDNGYKLRGGFIAQYKNKEFSLPFTIIKTKELKKETNYNFLFDFDVYGIINENIPEAKSPQKLIYNFQENNDVLKVFDTAVLENGSTGNHFVFGFHPIGYDYIKLKHKQREVKFKIYNNSLYSFYSPDSTTVFVTDYYNDLGYYRVVLE